VVEIRAHVEQHQSVLTENRKFPPSAEFSKQAHIATEDQYQQIVQKAKDDPPASGANWPRTSSGTKSGTSLEGEMPKPNGSPAAS